MPMNKFSTLKFYFADKPKNMKTNSDEMEFDHSIFIPSNVKPSQRVINFLLLYSQSLEVKKGNGYHLN